ncbi:hypothetical protein WN943_019157 [Citrus x changshan-huyou]
MYESTASMPVTEHTASIGICGQDDNALFVPFQGFLAQPRESRNLNVYRFRLKITKWRNEFSTRLKEKAKEKSCPRKPMKNEVGR